MVVGFALDEAKRIPEATVPTEHEDAAIIDREGYFQVQMKEIPVRQHRTRHRMDQRYIKART